MTFIDYMIQCCSVYKVAITALVMSMLLVFNEIQSFKKIYQTFIPAPDKFLQIHGKEKDKEKEEVNNKSFGENKDNINTQESHHNSDQQHLPESTHVLLKDVYRYHPPSNKTTEDTSSDKIADITGRKSKNTEDIDGQALKCGISPTFEKFFELDISSRSANNEDNFIYNTFFKDRPMDDIGTYIELGAFDGMKESNTHFFDSCLGWEGILIEGNPRKYDMLLKNRPNAHRLNFAPSCQETGSSIPFYATLYTNAGIPSHAKAYDNTTVQKVDVPCGPLGPVLETIIEKKHVDFFSLDVEGAELLILDTIDFETVQIDILMIEIVNNYCKKKEDCKVRNDVRAKMEELGFARHEDIVPKSDVYVHPKSPYQM